MKYPKQSLLYDKLLCAYQQVSPDLAGDPAHADELNAFTEKMLEMMKKYNNPAYEAYRDRDQAGVIEGFMEEQRIKAKNTKPVVRY